MSQSQIMKSVWTMLLLFITILTFENCNAMDDCSLFSNCNECLSAEDLNCGWCLLESRCSLHANCKKTFNNSSIWIDYKTSKCPAITSIVPRQIQRTTAQMVLQLNRRKLKLWTLSATHSLNFILQIALTVDHLPLQSDNFVCAFIFADSLTIYTNATINQKNITCDTPDQQQLPGDER